MLSKQQIQLLKQVREFFEVRLPIFSKRMEWLEGKVYEEIPANIEKSRNLNTFSSVSGRVSQLEDRLTALEEDFKQVLEGLQL